MVGEGELLAESHATAISEAWDYRPDPVPSKEHSVAVTFRYSCGVGPSLLSLLEE